MKKLITASGILVSLLAVTACSENQTERTADKVADSTRNAYEETKDFMGDSWDSIKDTTFAQKNKFKDTMSDMGDSIESQYRKIKGNSLGEEAKQNIENALDRFKRSMSRLGNATADTWDDAKDDAHDAWENLKDAYQDATH